MNIYDFFEECNLDQAYENDQFIYQVQPYIPDRILIQAAKKWLEGIGNQHQVPGNTVYTTAGICDYYRELGAITHRQQIYLIANLSRYWNQISCVARAEMML